MKKIVVFDNLVQPHSEIIGRTQKVKALLPKGYKKQKLKEFALRAQRAAVIFNSQFPKR